MSLELLVAAGGQRHRVQASEECALAIEPRQVGVDELETLEALLGWRFPEAYRRCVSELGLARLDRWFDGYGPDSYDRMLAPSEILEICTAFKTWVEDCEVHESEEQAAKQQGIRDRLVPFQYLGDGTSWDVYCFVMGDSQGGRPRVIGAYHDDDELHLWLDEPADRLYGFGAHIQAWLLQHIPPSCD